MIDTIYALSSGDPPSGVAIIRVSGPKCRFVIETMCTDFVFAEPVGLSDIVDTETKVVIDRGLVLSFVGPNSFTGEDVAEFQVHGGRAVVDAILSSLAKIDDLRHAEAGEFAHRAFENCKFDLTQAEGLADLIASETEAQRKQAFDAAAGRARNLLEGWLDKLTSMRALIEAEIDFVDENDIPGSVSDRVWSQVDDLIGELDKHLVSINAGEIIRNGFRVALMGKPNAGKSTLVNCLAGRDIAIVTDIAGTTRDVLEVRLNLNGKVVIVSDTAGIHETENPIEIEGIRRAKNTAENSDMTIWIHAADDVEYIADNDVAADLVVLSKKDKVKLAGNTDARCNYDLAISSTEGDGISDLVKIISDASENSVSNSGDVIFTRARQRDGIVIARNALAMAGEGSEDPLEIRAENLRFASEAFGKLVGRIDVEDILGVIFSEFCVGK